MLQRLTLTGGNMERMQSAGKVHNEAGLNPDLPAVALSLNFRQAPLRLVLKYIHDAAGLRIEVEPNVEVERLIELRTDEPVTKEEAIRLLDHALDGQGYMVLNKHGRLAIIPRQDAKKHYIPLPKLGCRSFAG